MTAVYTPVISGLQKCTEGHRKRISDSYCKLQYDKCNSIRYHTYIKESLCYVKGMGENRCSGCWYQCKQNKEDKKNAEIL
jgi:hypothetical protein